MEEAEEAVAARRPVHRAGESSVLPALTNECPLSDSRRSRYKVRSWPAASVWKVDRRKGQPSVMGTKYVVPSPDSIVSPRQESTPGSSCHVQGVPRRLSGLLEDTAEEQLTGREDKGSEEKTFFPCGRVCSDGASLGQTNG